MPFIPGLTERARREGDRAADFLEALSLGHPGHNQTREELRSEVLERIKAEAVLVREWRRMRGGTR